MSKLWLILLTFSLSLINLCIMYTRSFLAFSFIYKLFDDYEYTNVIHFFFSEPGIL